MPLLPAGAVLVVERADTVAARQAGLIEGLARKQASCCLVPGPVAAVTVDTAGSQGLLRGPAAATGRPEAGA